MPDAPRRRRAPEATPAEAPAGDAYPAEPTPTTERLQCQVCGQTFVLVDHPDDGDEIPNLSAFLVKHRRCVQRTLTAGGTLARPAPRRRDWPTR
jgi:hypothetical protein